MKKLLFLLLLPLWMVAQSSTGQETPFDYGIKIETGAIQTVTNPVYPATMGTDGTIGRALAKDLPIDISPLPLNYTITDTKLGSHLGGIDKRLGEIGNTTAGLTNRIYFTAVPTTITAGTFYTSSATGKGAVAGVLQTVSNDDNVKNYFGQDVISIAQPSATTAPPGNYSGQLSVMVDSNSAQERFTVEIYKTDNNGTPIASGITGAPVGNLGVTVVAILDSGVTDLVASSVSNVSVSGNLASTLSLAVGERLRYHVSAQKVGTTGNAFMFSLFYGSDYNSYYDVTVTPKASTVVNDSGVSGGTAADALTNLNASKENVANKTTDINNTGVNTYPTTPTVKTALNLKADISSIPLLKKDAFIFSGTKIFTLSQPASNILSVVVDGKSYYDTGTNIQFRMNNSTELEILEELIIGEDINVVVTYNYSGLAGGPLTNSNINCWGDSLTAGAGGTPYPTVLQTLLPNYSVKNYGVGGENTNTIAARQGGIPMQLQNSFTLPSDGSNVQVWTTTDLGVLNKYGKSFHPLLQGGESSINPCYISGIECTLSKTGTSSPYTYFLKRNTPSSSHTVIPAKEVLYVSGNNKKSGLVNIYWMGQNGGFDTEDQLIDYYKDMIEYNKNSNYIIIGLHTGTAASRASLETKMYNAFGIHYFNWRKYVVSFGLEDAGLTPTTADNAAIAVGSCPPQLLIDTVHHNTAGYTVLANALKKIGSQIGIW